MCPRCSRCGAVLPPTRMPRKMSLSRLRSLPVAPVLARAAAGSEPTLRPPAGGPEVAVRTASSTRGPAAPQGATRHLREHLLESGLV